MKNNFLLIALLALSFQSIAQSDLTVGPSYQLNLQRQNSHADAWVLHNAEYSSSNDLLKWETTSSNFGYRGIRFAYSTGRGIYFYAQEGATTAGAEFTPVTRFFIGNDGKVGVGTTTPTALLDVAGSTVLGNTFNTWTSFGSINGGRIRGSNEGYLYLSSNPNGGGDKNIYYFTQPSYYHLFQGGNVGIGTSVPKQSLHVKGRIYLEGTESYSSGWLQNYFHWRGHSLIMGSEPGEYAHNTIELKPGGSASGVLESYFQMFTSTAPGTHLQKIQFATTGDSWLNGGNVGIGTNTPTQKLTVKGTVYSTEVKVDVNAGTGPDYVFEPTYILPTLAETEAYIKANKHLPEVPSAKEMEANGINLSEMNMLLLKKVEELTLHVIEQQKEIELLKEKIK